MPPILSWLRGYLVQQPLAQRRGLQAHTPPTGGCGPVCTHACVLAHSWHGAPPIPQRKLSVPGKQVSPEQQPGQSGVQSTSRPQLLVTTNFTCNAVVTPRL